MAAIEWDLEGEHYFETGVDHGVLYPTPSSTTGHAYDSGVAWNGISKISEKPSGAEPNAIYADNIKYLNLLSMEEFAATLEAYTAPDQFAACDGSMEIATGVMATQQTRHKFGLSYRTKIGNDEDGDAKGYKLHIVYNCLAAPSEKDYETINDSPAALTMSWEISTTPVNFIKSGKTYATAHLEIDSTTANATKLAALEAKLYGSSTTSPYIPTIADVITTLS